MQSPTHNPKPDTDLFFCDGEPEVRSTEGGGIVVAGYAALFNSRSRVMRTQKGVQFTESIAPGAFDNTDFSDAFCCFDHRDFLASEPTLRFGVDARGLHYEYDHDPNDPVHVTALQRIRRRNAKGSSFTFSDLPSDCYTVTDEAGMKHRTITRFPRVFEFGPVLLPAYPATSTFVRSLDEQPELSEPEPQLPDPRLAESRRVARR